ncbi:MAG: hypothetical protein NTW37_07085 [Proteobacteria bacterium]|nr:hypothetical protein [Pseudomonadota bacterium]
MSAATPFAPGQAGVPGASRAQVATPSPAGLPRDERRRQGSRRAGFERRRHQVSVMLDTRTGRDRRGARRRTDDPPPARVVDAA